MRSLTIILIVLVFSFKAAQTKERPICAPTGTCLPKDGSIDERILLPGSNGRCPDGKKRCAQNTMAIGCGYTFNNNIFQDGLAPYGSHPWLAYITNQTGFTGSGVLLDRYHVLTAAHKVYRNKYSLQKLHVYIGVHNRNAIKDAYKRNVEDMIIHPNFDPITLKNDLAVLRLKAHVPLGYMKTVGAACLPRSDAIFTGQRCVVAGWGVTEFNTDVPSNNLKQVVVPIVSYEICRQSMQNLLGAQTDIYLDRDGEICAGGEAGRDACTDDGGAPLICRDERGNKVIAGLVIWGKKCGEPNVYGVYVDVPKYVEWISRVIRILRG